MKYIFVENGLINGAGFAERMDDGVLNIKVSEEIYEDYVSDPLKYVYKDNEIVSNPNYEDDHRKFLNQQRIAKIYDLLEELDAKRIRAICENEVKNSETGETWLEYYNKQISDLRAELSSLSGDC